MEHSHTAKILPPLALLSAIALTALRVFHLRNFFDSDGMLPAQSSVLLITVLACAGFFLVLTLFCLRLNRLPGTEACFPQWGVWAFPKFVAAALLLAGTVLLLQNQTRMEAVWKYRITLVGALSAPAMVWTICSPRRGKSIFPARLLPALFTVAALIFRFRTWSHDPLVIHITPALLAWVCCAMETMLLSGFPLGAGHRRSSVLFGLSAGIFTCMTMADYLLGQKTDIGEALTLLGLAVWCTSAALELLQFRVQNELPASAEMQQAEGDTAPTTEPLPN
ncbi:MAG: hypothetical protein J5878_06550 [Oscillospiraceae bacterium]|nr:hypothetical protein [Oscillospiraceae bacterium]